MLVGLRRSLASNHNGFLPLDPSYSTRRPPVCVPARPESRLTGSAHPASLHEIEACVSRRDDLTNLTNSQPGSTIR